MRSNKYAALIDWDAWDSEDENFRDLGDRKIVIDDVVIPQVQEKQKHKNMLHPRVVPFKNRIRHLSSMHGPLESDTDVSDVEPTPSSEQASLTSVKLPSYKPYQRLQFSPSVATFSWNSKKSEPRSKTVRALIDRAKGNWIWDATTQQWMPLKLVPTLSNGPNSQCQNQRFCNAN